MKLIPAIMAEKSVGSGVAKPIQKKGIFENPWLSWDDFPGFFQFLKFRNKEKDHSNVPSKKEEIDKELPMHKPQFLTPQESDEQMSVTWIGHATVVVQMDGATVITDPIWSDRCSPLSFAGPKRYRDPPCRIQDLPQVDIAVISHNHYDHLDSETVKNLERQFGKEMRWFVPLKLKSWMESCGCRDVTELNWGEEATVDVRGKPFQIVCLPAQHWSLRNGMDRYKSLWSGWGVLGPKRRLYFAGDTGFCPEFDRIGEVYGPFDVGLIPIGCYEPRWFMYNQHIDPAEAVKIHRGIRAVKSLAIHWGTFNMGSTEFYLEPRSKLKEEVAAAGIGPEDFVTKGHGETWRHS